MPSRVDEVLRDVDGRGVTVIEAETVKETRRLLDIGLHVRPKPRRVGGRRAETIMKRERRKKGKEKEKKKKKGKEKRKS